MSNDKMCEKHIRRKSKVSWVKVIFPGLVGARLKGVADGKRVNSPVLVRPRDGGTENGRQSGYWIPVQARRRALQANPQG